MGIDDQFRRAVELHQAGRLAEAEGIYREIIQLNARHAGALHMLGVVAHQCGRHDAAVDLINQSIRINPADAAAYNNLGEAFRAMEQLGRAIGAYRRSLQLSDRRETRFNFALVLNHLGRLDEAAHECRRAIALAPADARSVNLLGVILRNQGRLADAIGCFREAVGLDGGYGEALNNLGVTLSREGEIDFARDALQRAIDLDASSADPRCNLAQLLQSEGRIEEAIETYRAALALDPDSTVIHSNLLYATLFQPDLSPAQSLAEHRSWNQKHAARLAQEPPPAFDRDTDRPLRVGYVSPDLDFHSVGRCLLPILRHHDRRRVQAVLYADVPAPDVYSRRLAECAEWVNIVGMSEAELAARIRADRIDVLVDLTLHSAHNRLLTFARRAAPVQVTYLGYPGTSGMTAMDYRLSDPWLDPPDNDALYSEKTVRLGRGYWCCPEPDDAITPPVGGLPAESRGFVTFASLNQFAKIGPNTLAAWGELLASVPGSRLLMHCPASSIARQRVLEVLAGFEVAAERVSFIGRTRFEEFVRLGGEIDIALDSFPYTGAVTTMDTLQMGVPVVTLAGTVAVQRGGVSILANAGLPELIAQSVGDYVRIARELASDLARLRELRAGMRQRLRGSPLMDAAGLARELEEVYRRMWIERVTPRHTPAPGC